MMASVHIQFKRQYLTRPVNLVIVAYLLIAGFTLQNYLQPGSVNVMLGLLALPFVWKVEHAGRQSYRYAWLTLLLLVLCFFMPVKTLLFFSIGFALLFFTESFYGKTNLLALLLVLIASPVFRYIGDVFSFPIRLYLTTVAGAIFTFLGTTVEVKGNMITHSGNEFAVDPACMGLNMIAASFLAAIILIGFYQAKYNRRPGVLLTMLYLVVILLLNVVGNLFRIMLLVQFNIQPGTLSHEIAGLTCLLFYVLVPAAKIANWTARRSPVAPGNASSVPVVSTRYVVLNLLLLLATLLLSFKVLHSDTFTRFKIPAAKQVANYAVSSPAPGIVKLEKPGVLVYIKFIRGFYDTEHNPMICWVGSGYQFRDVSMEKIYDRKVFTATIVNNTDKFYSAWWYDNGKKNTISQFEWRWDLLTGGDNYVLVNISCSHKEELAREIQKIVDQKTLAIFLNT